MPYRLLSMQDELSGWFGAMKKDAGPKAGAADRGFWLKAYNGGSHRVHRVVRGGAFVPNLSIGVLGGIQPEPLLKIIGDTTDDGLIQRFLPVMLRSAKAGTDIPAGDGVAAYGRLIEALTQLKPPPGAGNLGRSTVLRFDPGALAIRERFEIENVELVAALETVSPKLAAHLGKHDGMFARICLLFHCIEHADSPTLPAEVSEATASRVVAFFVDYIRPSAIAFYAGLLGMSAGHEDLMALASLIVADKLDEVSARDVQRSSRALRHVTSDEARRLCEKLTAFGWLEPIDPKGKHTAPRWRVSPAVHEIFADRAQAEAERRAKSRAAFAEAMAGGTAHLSPPVARARDS